MLDTTTETHVVEGMAKALFCTWWANWAEHRVELTGERLPWSGGDQLMEVMPDLPKDAMVKAAYLAGQISSLNGEDLFYLCYNAAKKDGHPDPRTDEVCNSDYWESMGHAMAMEALGYGVGWADDHADPEWKMPSCEVDFYDPIRFPDAIPVGQPIAMPIPDEEDGWLEPFVGILTGYDTGTAIVRDENHNFFEIEIDRLKIHNDD